jgi:RNA polymerase sigma-70 factor (ECF subfamily)
MPRQSSHKQNGSPDSHPDKESYFFSLMETYQNKLFRYICFRVGDREIALDITQECFTKTWKYLASGKSIEYEEAFLYRIAKNAVVDFFKKKKSISLDFLETKGFDAAGTDEAAQAEKNSELEYLQSLIENLSEEDKQLIMLRYGEERSLDDIAALYHRTPNAIAVKIHRIVNKLKENYQ